MCDTRRIQSLTRYICMEVRDLHVVAVDSYKKTTRAMFQNPFIRSFGQFPGRRQACQRTNNLRIYIHQPSQYVSEILRPDQVSKFYGKNRVGMSILFVLEKRIENRRSERPRVNGESCSMAFNSDRNAAGQPLPSNQSIDVES